MTDQGELLERGAELDRLGRLIAGARAGAGAALVVEGEAGIGKTRLLEAARAQAAAAEFTVLSARGGELERDFGYGVARQLFERELLRLPTAERAALLSGAAARAAPVLGLGDQDQTAVADAGMATDHGLYWVAVDLAARAPLMLCVDDAHWSDRATLRSLAYIARRIKDLPVALVIGWRSGEPGAPEDLLGALRDAEAAGSVAPGPLSASACTALVREVLGGAADEAFSEACREVSGGNPFLLGELVRALAAEGVAPTARAADRILELGPAAVARSVLVRLARLPAPATALARALAVLDTDAELELTAGVAGMAPEQAAEVLRLLAAAHIADPGGAVRFAHPILRAAVYRDLGEADWTVLHRSAARLLAERGLGDRAAVHLLNTPPTGEPWVRELLRDAGGQALRRGSPDTAVTLLRRALEMATSESDRWGILLELGRAERFAGDGQAERHLREAFDLGRLPAQRAAAAAELSKVLHYDGRGEETIELLEAVIDELPADARELALGLEVELSSVSSTVNHAAPRLAKRLAALAAEATGSNPAERALLASYALFSGMRGAPAEVVSRVAERAWVGGRLARDLPDEQAPCAQLAIGLIYVDELAWAHDVAEQSVAAARDSGSVSALTLALSTRAYVAWAQGDLRHAEAAARESLHLATLADAEMLHAYTLAMLVVILAPAGQLDLAETVLAEHDFLDQDPPDTVQTTLLLHARSELRLAQGRIELALRDVQRHMHRTADRAAGTLAASTRVRALVFVAAGQPERALELAEARLEVALATGMISDQVVLYGARGLAKGGEEGLADLEQAAALTARSPRKVVNAQALLDCGAALRRAKRRVESREPLRRALELARASGAGLIERRADEELRATGARPRRIVLSGADSLTASERRIADLAAAGATTREIAQTLFVTPKTVETHLRAVFRKLDISSRKDIAAALAADAPGSVAEEVVLATILAVSGADLETVGAALARFRGREVSRASGGLLAAFDAPTLALQCAAALREQAAGLRAGVDVGECRLSNGAALRGPALDAAAHLAQAASPGEIIASADVRALVSEPGLAFSEHPAAGWRIESR